MKVILTQDIAGIGNIGDLVTVKDGFGRNYLIPEGKGIQATSQNIKKLEHQKRQIREKLSKTKREAEKLAARIEAVSCTVAKAVGEEDKLFGSVTSMDMEASLTLEGIEIDRKKIILPEPIKALGIYQIPIKLHTEVTAALKLWVVKE
ncbi:MAG: 50S ribosomal protein L9 [Proteobacteria bacterium]|nr:50S ribosomal protein L9 [Pseudomonadota bacterium]